MARPHGMSRVSRRKAQPGVEQAPKMKTLRFAIFAVLALALLAAVAVALLVNLSASID